jgi:hydrogenase/urease accessory protein HupE
LHLLAAGIIFATALGIAARPASSHVTSLSTARIAVGENDVTLTLSVNRADVEAVFGLGVPLEQVGAALLAVSRIATAIGEPCAGDPAAPRAEGEHLVFESRWRCPAAAPLVYESELWLEIDPQVRQVVVIAGTEGEVQAVLDANRTSVALGAETGGFGDLAWRFLVSGVEHIFIGYDHVAFLLAVVLWSRRLIPLVKVVTAFSVAHSITLSLAATGVLEISGDIVEPLIALSIVFVAAENFFVNNIDRRWRITFFLGLIHGFGFAGVLAEFGLPRDGLLVALGAFNIGVEIGQIAILAIVLPTLVAIERFLVGSRDWLPSPRLVYALSAPIVALGCWWSFERIVLG